MEFSNLRICIPTHDCDVAIELPGGKEITLQFRPSNADVHYNGSLDIILPDNDIVSCFEGDDLKKAETPENCRPHEKLAKQLVCTLPGSYD
jgi:hypothetical protein